MSGLKQQLTKKKKLILKRNIDINNKISRCKIIKKRQSLNPDFYPDFKTKSFLIHKIN